MRLFGIDTFVISRTRTTALNIRTRFVVDRSLLKIPVNKVLSRSTCPEASIVVILLILELS